mmetsp:Transcript_30018/g.44378  ORF Transcript_30018/g.44378 Transcript_30018/m.44378 type:complete len:395 (+) Transcript_30018:216-1400(+)|eukprot:CAMPEP_0194245356 /NCGR_PEP_ID=MMETSP0158-20130606/13068_1 /TAXON_ID=33649 /ORGANISM="Thalassionema nitzschioides, Strain L26-B" /LENGTH=394 /DNA_ID=CAMNT_0038981045 /DNA_START=82 /DNA_END=1266 /DNA_ORIENTATION=-
MPALHEHRNRHLRALDEEQSGLDNMLANGIFSITKNENNFDTEYSCTQLVQYNEPNFIEINFLYDLISPETGDPDFARQQFEFLLLQRIASYFGLQNGSSCLMPPTKDDDAFTFSHMIQATSLPDDLPNPQLSECLTPFYSNQTCISYVAALSMKILGPDDKNDMIDFIAHSIDDGIITSGSSLEAAFLGTQILDETNDVLPAINTIEISRNPTDKENVSKPFTSIGVVLVVGLTVAFIGLMFVVWRTRQRRKKWLRENVIMASNNHSLNKEQPDIRDTQDTTDGSDEKEEPAEVPQNFGLDCYAASDNSFTDLDDVVVQDNNKPSYEFDLGNSMKSSLFGVHGQRRSTPFFPELESSSVADSDVDSWAQTDATIGSLDERISVVVGDGEVAEI